MIILTMIVFSTSPFYSANFFLPIRSLSAFSNPAGLGISTGAEAFVTYDPESELITTGASAGNIGFGYIKEDTFQIYEVAIGYRLPGAFTIGYAYEFGDTSEHVLGVECRPNQQLSLSYRTELDHKRYVSGGIEIMPYLRYITLSFGVTYEGIDDTLAFYYGALVSPISGLGAFFYTDKEFNWNAGMELSFGYGKITGSYSYENSKFSGGLLISAQKYETFIAN
ncbi:MAG: hypothetical protein OEV79_01270 [candidate division WOR-3 bacterium]|nr:hypothetical protein [candidate division WOR-3 bacterium]